MTDINELSDRELLHHIAEWEEQAAALSSRARAAREEYLHRKRAAIAEAYTAKGDPFGVIHLYDGEYELELNTPKRVEWDQEQLAALQAVIRDEWNSDPAEFIEAKLSVKESKYKAWPSELKARFETARVVKAGTPSLTLKA